MKSTFIADSYCLFYQWVKVELYYVKKERKKKRSKVKGKLASETFCNRYLIVFIVADSAQSEAEFIS